jgi:conjugal transfer/type IV secretion protein DotA/TraY
LVQLTAMGKGIVDQALFNIMVGAGIEFAGGAMQQIDSYKTVGKGLDTIGDAWFTVAMLGLGIGMILYYIVPFMPFLYFFFSVVKWVQSIFESMIGMPMWALAHLRIDGDGIPGKAAADGYFLLLEVLIRPALTVISLVASLVLFTGMVYALNDMFDLMMVNLAGYYPPTTGSMTLDQNLKSGSIDLFFYTILYAVLAYMMALSCFKLIDQIPAEILRWIGSEAKNIIDDQGNKNVESLIQNVYMGNFGMPLVQDQGQMSMAVKGHRRPGFTGGAGVQEQGRIG